MILMISRSSSLSLSLQHGATESQYGGGPLHTDAKQQQPELWLASWWAIPGLGSSTGRRFEWPKQSATYCRSAGGHGRSASAHIVRAAAGEESARDARESRVALVGLCPRHRDAADQHYHMRLCDTSHGRLHLGWTH